MAELGEFFRRLIPPKIDVAQKTGRFAEIAFNRLDRPNILTTGRGLLAYGTGEGVNYSPKNEDAVVVDTIHDAYAVIDGMGGMGHGDVAARILAEELMSGFQKGADVQRSQRSASERMAKAGVGKGGACYLAFKIRDGAADGWYAGDVQLAVLRNNHVSFVTSPENLPMKRNVVTNSVRGVDAGATQRFTVELKDGDRIIVASDGLWDNISPEDVLRHVTGLPIHDAIKTLDALAKKKMTKGGKPDNISVVIYDISPTRNGSDSPMSSLTPSRVAGTERSVSSSIPPSISHATSWDELNSIIRQGPGIQGSSEFYTPAQLERILADVRAGVIGVNYVTSAGGLREKVRELLGSK